MKKFCATKRRFLLTSALVGDSSDKPLSCVSFICFFLPFLTSAGFAGTMQPEFGVVACTRLGSVSLTIYTGF